MNECARSRCRYQTVASCHNILCFFLFPRCLSLTLSCCSGPQTYFPRRVSFAKQIYKQNFEWWSRGQMTRYKMKIRTQWIWHSSLYRNENHKRNDANCLSASASCMFYRWTIPLLMMFHLRNRLNWCCVQLHFVVVVLFFELRMKNMPKTNTHWFTASQQWSLTKYTKR